MDSSSTRVRRHHVFVSFHGPDVRRAFLGHLQNHFASKGITVFKDKEIERGQTIGPELKQAIRESRISIVILSEKYASSSWCLDELEEILNCKEDQGQPVMTIFYKVEPSDVRKQSGNFGSAFKKTCERKTKEEKDMWRKALTYVANIAGEDSLEWEDEAEMIEKIAADVSNKLNHLTPSKDFEGMVGMEAHLKKMDSYIRLDYDQVKMIGIQGPAGIGKTTIARALFHQLSPNFQLKCFIENLKGTYGIDGHDSKLNLQHQLLSKILNQKDVKIHHLGAIKEWLQDQKVFIVLDDVDDLQQLEVLANEPSWFGSGSRIIVTTKDRNILKAHWVQDIYHVGYPSKEEALEILCLSAFKKTSPSDGFEKLAKKIANICGNLPLGLCVMGSSLRGESWYEWERQISKLENSLDRKLEDVLRVGYDKLLRKDQSLFLHIAFFFNNENVDHVKRMLADSNLDISNGLETLADKSLVRISTCGWIQMHCLLQQLGRQLVHEQSDNPGKRQFLVDAREICDVLANETGTGSVLGISFDMSRIREFSISGRAFEGMRNLRFLKIYGRYFRKDITLDISEDMRYLPRLRLLHWDSYPRKRLPLTFRPECLIQIRLQFSKLEKLWGGIQPLPNLKKINLEYSKMLKEIPDLSMATNLESLTLNNCIRLVQLHSSIWNLHKLIKLRMADCEKLGKVPIKINFEFSMRGFSRVGRTSPMIIKYLDVGNTNMEEVHPSIVERLPRLEWLRLGGTNVKRITHVPESIRHLDLTDSIIESIPDCVRGLPCLESLIIYKCRQLVSLQGLPPSLKYIDASNCESLKRVCFSYNDLITDLLFSNCFNLDEEARRVILQHKCHNSVWLPGREVPAEFTHKATGNSIIVPMVLHGEETFSANSGFKACLVLPPTKKHALLVITCRIRSRSGAIRMELKWDSLSHFHYQAKHLFICGAHLAGDIPEAKILFEFSCQDNHKIIACGVRIFSKEAESTRGSTVSYSETGSSSEYYTDEGEDYEPEAIQISRCDNSKENTYTCCWSWLKKLLYGENDDDEEEDKTLNTVQT